MLSKIFNIPLLIIAFAFIIHCTNAYRLDAAETNTKNFEESNELKDPYFIQRLQALLANAVAKDNANHEIQTRLAVNRRPGLLRLKKSE